MDRKGVYHGRHQIKSSHADADVLVIDTRKNHVLILGDEMRMGWDDLRHCKQGNVLHWACTIRCLSDWVRKHPETHGSDLNPG